MSRDFSFQNIQRLQSLSSHLDSNKSSVTIPDIMATPVRVPITCHVLDTTTGRPAANMRVKLTCATVPDIIFDGTTNTDGRIANWKNENDNTLVKDHGGITEALKFIIREQAATGDGTGLCPAGSSLWKLQFATGEHYGAANTFFPIVELTFLVKQGEHFHVPLLLGPFSFTTYRGS